MACQRDVLSLGLGSNRKIDVSRQEGFHFDEINPDPLESIYRFVTFLGICSRNIPWPFETVDEKAGHDNPGTKKRTLLNRFTPETQLYIALTGSTTLHWGLPDRRPCL